MTLPSSGQIALSDINTELGYSSTSYITLNDTPVRNLAGITTPNSTIRLPQDFWGKSNTTYTVTPASSNVDEGSSVTFNVAGTSIPNGTYYWTVTNPGDFGTSAGSFTISGNVGSFSVGPLADNIAEGTEYFTASIRSGSTSGTILATSTSVSINDTSAGGATFNISPSSGSVNEGGVVTFNVTGTNITDGTYYWTVTNQGDFDSSSGSFYIGSNTGSFNVYPSLDYTTEGTEYFTASVRTGSVAGTVVATSSSVAINDTSTEPPSGPSYTIYPDYYNINEGAQLGINITGSGIPNGTYYWTVSRPEDFYVSSGSVSIINNSGAFLITPLDDAATEGTETFTVSLHDGSIYGTVLATTGTINILDTSQGPSGGFTVSSNLGSLGNRTVSNSSQKWTAGNQVYASVYLTMETNGTWFFFSDNQGITLTGSYGSPTGSGAASGLYVRFTRTSYTANPNNVYGSPVSGSTGWIPIDGLNSYIYLYLGSTVTTSLSATFTVEVSSNSSGSPVLGSASSITLTCNVV